MTRTNLFYAIGKSETELFAYDEDSDAELLELKKRLGIADKG